MILDGAKVLITGGTGSFGREFIKQAIKTDVNKLIVFSRDELKQYEIRNEISDERLQFFVGDIRDRDRLYRALAGDIDYVIHAAALKQVPSCEYNPFEAIKTNILGAANLIDAAIDRGVKRVIALSSDKAVGPINLYGATKLCSDKLFVAGNSYSGNKPTRLSVVRYGNVVGSRGSVIPFFLKERSKGVIPITDMRMTRFSLTLKQGVKFVLDSLERMKGGEIFVPKIPSMRIIDLARAIAPDCRVEVVGIRPGEKLHEAMITEDDSPNVMEFDDHYVITPAFHWWRKDHLNGGIPVKDGFSYRSDTNTHWLGKEDLQNLCGDA
jgi:UDP-N-acetylglucosamine 4,6-dehydratase/5-epimerase